VGDACLLFKCFAKGNPSSLRCILHLMPELILPSKHWNSLQCVEAWKLYLDKWLIHLNNTYIYVCVCVLLICLLMNYMVIKNILYILFIPANPSTSVHWHCVNQFHVNQWTSCHVNHPTLNHPELKIKESKGLVFFPCVFISFTFLKLQRTLDIFNSLLSMNLSFLSVHLQEPS